MKSQKAISQHEGGGWNQMKHTIYGLACANLENKECALDDIASLNC